MLSEQSKIVNEQTKPTCSVDTYVQVCISQRRGQNQTWASLMMEGHFAGLSLKFTFIR